MKYRKKPVEIEAMQLVGDAPETFKVCNWMVDNGYPWLLGNALEPETLFDRKKLFERPDKGIWVRPEDGAVMIRTPEGDTEAPYGSWIIKGANGEFYSCPDDIFHETYAEVEDESVEDEIPEVLTHGLQQSWHGAGYDVLWYEHHTVLRNSLSSIAIPNENLGVVARGLLEVGEATLKYNEDVRKATLARWKAQG